MPDVIIHNHGSVILIEPSTEAAKAWVEGNVSVEGWQWIGPGFACEPRMADALITGMQNDGLEVE